MTITQFPQADQIDHCYSKHLIQAVTWHPNFIDPHFEHMAVIIAADGSQAYLECKVFGLQ
jgi:hypothetical protein